MIVEMSVSGKRTSLFRQILNYSQKSFITLGTAPQSLTGTRETQTRSVFVSIFSPFFQTIDGFN
jgi:hypothetical protein